MKKRILCILALCALLLVSCTETAETHSASTEESAVSQESGTDETSVTESHDVSHEESSDAPSDSSADTSSDSTSSDEESDTSEKEPSQGTDIIEEERDWEALFLEIYGFYPDRYQALSDTEIIKELAKAWLTNPIDRWSYAYAIEQYAPVKWSQGATAAAKNWRREMAESIAYIKECLPAFGEALEQEQSEWAEAVSLRKELPEMLVYELDTFGSMHFALFAFEVEELYRERAFRLLYLEAICKEEFGHTDHSLAIKMEIPEGMEASPLEEPYYASVFGDAVDPFWIASMESIDLHIALLADNPIDKWASEYTTEFDDYDYMQDVVIANWQREIQECTDLILRCYPSLQELVLQEAEAWEKGILGQDCLGIVLETDRYGTLHLLLARGEAVAQYRRRAFRMLYLAMACAEQNPTESFPDIEFFLPRFAMDESVL